MVMSLYRTIKGHTGTYKRRKNRELERSLGSLEATLPREMVSRRKILSRSRDDLNLDQSYITQEEEEDVWYQKEKLYKEHIQEVLDKWTQIDDEIWAKVIVFERNRRVAKAYARAPVLTINGSDDGFDGMRIGLCGFDNPMRDHKTEEVKRHVGQGVKIKMDDAGNILIRRYSKSNVYVKSTASQPNEETAIGADILKLPGQAIESEKIVKLFDMKKFQSNVNRELRRAYPDRRRLETQCLSAIAFVKSENDILDCPMWVLIINVVAMDMLKSKLPPAFFLPPARLPTSIYGAVQRPVDIKNRPRIPIPDEDPYSVAGNGGGSSGSSGFGASGSGMVAASREHLMQPAQPMGGQRRSEKPPKLPPRDNLYATHEIGKPDYDDIEDENRVKLPRGKSDKGKDNKKYDDPYYCGLRARVPNFVKSSKSSKENNNNGPNAAVGGSKETVASKRLSIAHLQHPASLQSLHQLHQMHPHHNLMAAHQHHQQLMWHARSYESGIDTDVVESPYSHMYGRVPLPTRGYIPAPRAMYIGEWD
ncbi:uncharacterized protein LOC128305684 isoform X1 [Anopheles moucheti]|uniref:uncharacterized protein LOC128711057 n=1 Tax=Anopheles marshallii TaxID=1521116 RepID=UPI0022F04EF3|nr:uncharacterized protein LOC128305684 isoform X1 [Anopheles moucheti]XP_052899217.1 uncharacterized protein LOC128305684 isoform X1 [Anopheles moucheti]XP_053661899.1 uncharacterized protein LOC128711057 [Anopheles marshallii]